MSLTRIQQQALARLQKMALLDFRGPELIEPVLHELHQLIEFDTGGYFHPGRDGALDAFVEPSLARDLMYLYFEPDVIASEHQVIRRSVHDFEGAVLQDHGAQVMEQLLKVSVGELVRSDFYNFTLRPAELLDCMSLMLRTAQGAGVGVLKLYRGPRAPRFGASDVAMFNLLEPWLARTLQPGELDARDSLVHESAMLVATPQGRLLWTSPEADALMALAFGPRWYRRSELPHALQELLGRLRFAQRSLATAHAAPPQLELHNASGWFSLSATQLAAAVGEGRAVGVTITRRVQRVAYLLNRLRTLGLPQRQQEMAYWLARGLPEDEIAARMRISINTATYHRRQIYARLVVINRHELQALLLGGR